MLIRRVPDLLASEITDERLFWNRRDWLRTVGLGAATVVLPGRGASAGRLGQDDELRLTPYDAVTGYNNFYEFGTDKSDPAENAHTLRPRPWSVTIEGDVKRPGTFDLEDVLKGLPVVERVYRLRCVEGWSMVVPWMGVPLGGLIMKLEPGTKAKFVEFTTLNDSKQMPGQRRSVLEWPYVEGLRMDEARHSLTLLVTGVYGKPLPNQNGAPIRLIAPWKYGFKGGKSIVKMRFMETQPRNTWNIAAPDEYGFYANVNPNVDHPRWSQKRERRVGSLFPRPTLMFNGYADQVGSLYAGMDLRVNF